MTWATEFQDEERKRYHEQKMISKDTRPAAQLALLGNEITPGTVRHLSIDIETIPRHKEEGESELHEDIN